MKRESDLRFITRDQAVEGMNLYHLARTAGKTTTHERLTWAANQLAEKYKLKRGGCYKDLYTIVIQGGYI